MEDEIYLCAECFKYLPFQGQKNIIEGMWSWYLEVDNHYKVTDEDVMEDQIYVLPEKWINLYEIAKNEVRRG